MNGNIESETLLDIAKRNFEVAKSIYEKYSNDDGMLNIVAYHLQQCIELGLKHVLETHGVSYPGTHDIQQLINLLPSDWLPVFDKIEESADTISAMEAKTRYSKGYRTSSRNLTKVCNLALLMVEEIESMEAKEQEMIKRKLEGK